MTCEVYTDKRTLCIPGARVCRDHKARPCAESSQAEAAVHIHQPPWFMLLLLLLLLLTHVVVVVFECTYKYPCGEVYRTQVYPLTAGFPFSAPVASAGYFEGSILDKPQRQTKRKLFTKTFFSLHHQLLLRRSLSLCCGDGRDVIKCHPNCSV